VVHLVKYKTGMIINPKQALEQAREQGRALAHFNINNLEMVKAITQAAQGQDQPVFLAVTENAIKYAGLDLLVSIVQSVAKQIKVDLFLHLDHGKNMEVITKAIESGFSSIMFDGSQLSLEENIAQTIKVKELIKDKDIALEAEIGHVHYPGKTETELTEPKQAAEFAKRTKVDSLAVAVGTIHGLVKQANVDTKRLQEIKALVKVPLVIHGCSGLVDQQLKDLKQAGANKFNFDSEIRAAFIAGIKEKIEEKDPRIMLKAAMTNMREVARHKIKIITE